MKYLLPLLLVIVACSVIPESYVARHDYYDSGFAGIGTQNSTKIYNFPESQNIITIKYLNQELKSYPESVEAEKYTCYIKKEFPITEMICKGKYPVLYQKIETKGNHRVISNIWTYGIEYDYCGKNITCGIERLN